MIGDVNDATTGARSVAEDVGDFVCFDPLLPATFLHCFSSPSILLRRSVFLNATAFLTFGLASVETRVRSLCLAARSSRWASRRKTRQPRRADGFSMPMRTRGTRHQSAMANRTAITIDVGLPLTRQRRRSRSKRPASTPMATGRTS